MINLKKFSDALKEYRARKEMTQLDLANRIGISRSVLSQLENGIQKPTTKHLTLIRDRLGIDINQFVEDLSEKSDQKPYFGAPYDLPKDVAAIASMINDAKEAKRDVIIIIRLIDQVLTNEDRNLTANQIRILSGAKEIANRCLMTL